MTRDEAEKLVEQYEWALNDLERAYYASERARCRLEVRELRDTLITALSTAQDKHG